MKKLKTLKEIESVGTAIGIANYYVDIKEEAIKWVKDLKEAVWTPSLLNCEGKYDKWKEHIKPYEDFYDEEYNSFEEVMNWIKHFFNITEEDLK